MPVLDFNHARRQTNGEADPIVVPIWWSEERQMLSLFDGGAGWERREYSFPGIKPAEVGVQQLAVQRMRRELPNDDDTPVDLDLMARLNDVGEDLNAAVLGEHAGDLEEFMSDDERVDLTSGLLMKWQEIDQGPNRLRRLSKRERKASQTPTRSHPPTSSNGASSSSGISSTPTSPAITAPPSLAVSGPSGSAGNAYRDFSGGSLERP